LASLLADKKAGSVDISVSNEAKHSLKTAVDFLRSSRQDDGSWSHYPAVTALVVNALLRCPDDIIKPGDPAIEKGLDFITANVKPDGGIYTDDPMKSYNTSICMMALLETGNKKYDKIISDARKFVLTLQADENSGYASSDSLYGGIGYGDSGRPDLSNLQNALEVLANTEKFEEISESSLKPAQGISSKTNNKPYYEKAIIFLTRAQNLKSTNPYPWAGNDGGMMYFPGSSKAGGVSSYGSMTYAGLKSFIYAKVDKNDQRVKAAYKWICDNYSVTENPGIGDDGLFYYYHTMSKALNVMGIDFITSSDGKKNNWREDLINQLLRVQAADGSWANTNARWWETNKDLVTAYSMLSIINAGWPQ
jgi:squalene-hopene/tetraprenyl-beta-curcumene cyclase